MKAVITVVGHDTVGIIARVSNILSAANANILDITQSVMGDIFAMVMLVNISECTIKFTDLVEQLNALGNETSLQIHTMHEDIFNSMHRI